MPTLLRWRGYGFHFYSREPDEPPHFHVIKGRAQAKFCCRTARWLKVSDSLTMS
jgi:hypothetical protein